MADFFDAIIHNEVLWVSVFAWFMAQVIKILIDMYRYKTFSILLIVATGGMPSSHSAFVTALTVAVGFHEGFGTVAFAICAVFAMVVMSDAAGIRRAAGKQAALLNIMVENLNNPNISLDKKLRELLGHTPVEVAAGALLGICVGTLYGFTL